MPLPDLPALPEPFLILMCLGFTGLLVILRFDAQRFGAAEYDEPDRTGTCRRCGDGSPGMCWASAASRRST